MNSQKKINKKIHICFVSPTVYRYYKGQGLGGAELQIVQLAKMFVNAGYRVSILTNDFGQKDEEVYDGVTVMKAPLRFLGKSNWYLLPDSIRFVLKLVKLAPDFCFFKNPNVVLFWIALASKFQKKIKPVKIFASDADCNVKGKSIPQILYCWGVKWTDNFIFQTRKQQQIVQETLSKQGPVIRNIFFPPMEPQEPTTKDLDLLWVGNFDKKKYPEGFYETAKALPQYRFGMISKSIPEAYKELQQKIADLPNVQYFGMIPFQKTQKYFARSKVYLCTSITEGFPNTFLQAWWEKIPVVSLSFPCDGLLESEKIGMLAGSQEKLQNDIVRLLGDEQLRNSMGENGYQYIQKNHLPDQILHNYQNAFKL